MSVGTYISLSYLQKKIIIRLFLLKMLGTLQDELQLLKDTV